MRLADVPPRFDVEFLEWLRATTEAAWRALPERDRPGQFETSRPIPPGTMVPLPTGNFWRNETRWSPLTDAQIDAAEKRYAVAFPPDHRLFLRTLGRTLPLNESVRFGEGDALVYGERPGFYDWAGDEKWIREALVRPEEDLLFDVEHNDIWLEAWGGRPTDAAARAARVHEAVAAAPRLIPLVGHRYLLGDPPAVGNGVLSVHQTDLIEYGSDLRAFLLIELADFLDLDHDEAYEASCAASRHDWSQVPLWGEFVG